jgi:hypothetical protein
MTGLVDSGVGLGPKEPGARRVDSGAGDAGGAADGPIVALDPTQPATTSASKTASPPDRGPCSEPNLLFDIACLACPACALALRIFSKTTAVEGSL